MSERTALEIADRMDALLPFCSVTTAEMLRSQSAEIERLKTVPMKYRRMAFNAQLQDENKQLSEKIKQLTDEVDRLKRQNAAYTTLVKSQESQLSIHRARADEYLAAIANIDSERASNAILTDERDAAIAAAVAAERAEIERLKRERHHIYDLLARTHRDGGQYTAEHGVEKSCDDAEAQVVTWLETINSFDALIEQARIAEREACSKTCEREAVLYDIRGAYKTGNHCAEEIRARGKS